MKLLPYREGTWFAVPLANGGYGVGVVTRVGPIGRIILAYFFGQKWREVPTLEQVAHLRAGDAIRHLRTGDLGILNRRWPLIGDADPWDRKAWPMPHFIRRASTLQRAWRVMYCDTDPGKLEREESISYDSEGLESDSLFGYGATETLMTKLLS